MSMRLKYGSYFLIFLIIIAVIFLIFTLRFTRLEAQLTGILASAATIVLGIIQLLQEIKSQKEVLKAEKQPQKKAEANIFLRRTGSLALWVGGFTIVTYVLGFLISIPLFLISFLKCQHTGWRETIITAVVVTVLTYGLFEALLVVRLWRGLIPLF